MLKFQSIDLSKWLCDALSPWLVTGSKFRHMGLLLSRGLTAQKDEFIQDKKVNLTRVKIYDLLLCFLVTMIVFDTTCLYRKFPI